MRSFVSIRKMYNDISERNIDSLSKIYIDRSILYQTIEELLIGNIDLENIKSKKILLKPNLVRECLNEKDNICLFTNPSLIIETVHVLLEYGAEHIIIGDAPIQGCNWDKMIPDSMITELQTLSDKYNKPVKLRDFRKRTYDSKNGDIGKTNRKDSDYLIFDTGKRSWLEPITTLKNKFRVTCYDPRKMAKAHSVGKHQYCVAKEVFECDTIITMPKMKTHRMAGFTNSLKILVGINGDKDYLPHHRIGSTSCGGDCYKGFSLFRAFAEKIFDLSNMNQGKWRAKFFNKLGSVAWKLSCPKPYQLMNAGWYGNDTVWRMVLDLNIIVEYGTLNGELATTPQRTMWTLCDGIIGGQGDGPLHPDPHALGVLAFSNNPYLMDVVGGTLFGMDTDRIPLLREAKQHYIEKDIDITIDKKKSTMEDVRKLASKAQMSPGWVNYIEKK